MKYHDVRIAESCGNGFYRLIRLAEPSPRFQFAKRHKESAWRDTLLNEKHRPKSAGGKPAQCGHFRHAGITLAVGAQPRFQCSQIDTGVRPFLRVCLEESSFGQHQCQKGLAR